MSHQTRDERRRVPVRISRQNRQYPEAVLLTFTEPCPFCGQLHVHGSASATPGADGTYSERTVHCATHTHALTQRGRRAAVTDANRCPNDHPAYVLVPVAEVV
jgi:hypothetical protein